MSFHLVVTQPFGAYAKGALITDPEAVAALNGHPHTVRVVARETPAPEAEPDEKPEPKAKPSAAKSA